MEWTQFFDFISTAMMKHQDTNMNLYLPYPILYFKINCSSLHRPVLRFPKDFQVDFSKLSFLPMSIPFDIILCLVSLQLYSLSKDREEIVENLLSSMMPSIRQMYTKKKAIEELFPSLLAAITPQLQMVRYHYFNYIFGSTNRVLIRVHYPRQILH
jgi:hypothetical protein